MNKRDDKKMTGLFWTGLVLSTGEASNFYIEEFSGPADCLGKTLIALLTVGTVKRHKKEIIERLRGLLLKSYKMESLQESTGSGLPNRPPLVLCDHCVRGIKARGESLTQDEDFEIEEVDDGQGKCDWCGETHELSELSAYR